MIWERLAWFALTFYAGFVAGRLWDSVKLFFRKIGERRRQMTYVYCPGCRQELTHGDSKYWEAEGLVYYRCGKCNAKSCWDFDLPVPVLLHSQTP